MTLLAAYLYPGRFILTVYFSTASACYFRLGSQDLKLIPNPSPSCAPIPDFARAHPVGLVLLVIRPCSYLPIRAGLRPLISPNLDFFWSEALESMRLRSFLFFFAASTRLVAGDSTFSPARPPAVPLAVRSPYLSTWIEATLRDNGLSFGR